MALHGSEIRELNGVSNVEVTYWVGMFDHVWTPEGIYKATMDMIWYDRYEANKSQ